MKTASTSVEMVPSVITEEFGGDRQRQILVTRVGISIFPPRSKK